MRQLVLGSGSNKMSFTTVGPFVVKLELFGAVEDISRIYRYIKPLQWTAILCSWKEDQKSSQNIYGIGRSATENALMKIAKLKMKPAYIVPLSNISALSQ